MPRVSIVIPTRNRPHLLKVALESALRQTCQDFEILISDNYCGSEATRQVYEAFHDARLRYVRTDRLLAMPDSWEFALSHAQGEYVTVLSDDCYFFPRAIEIALAAAEQFKVDLAVWNTCTYYSSDWLEPFLRNHLSFEEPPYRTALLSSHNMLRELFNLDLDLAGPMPRFLNSLCHRSLVERVVQVHGRMFIPPCPDYSAAASLLANTDQYVFIGWPLAIEGATPLSIGITLGYGYLNAYKEFFDEFEATAYFRKLIDLQLGTVSVCVAQTLAAVKMSCSPECIPYDIDRRNMLLQSIRSVAAQERCGADVAEAWRILDAYIARQPEEVRRTAITQKRRSRLHAVLRSCAAQIIPWLPGWEYLAQFRGRRLFPGARHGFQNMEQCGLVAPQLIRRVARLETARPYVPLPYQPRDAFPGKVPSGCQK